MFTPCHPRTSAWINTFKFTKTSKYWHDDEAESDDLNSGHKVSAPGNSVTMIAEIITSIHEGFQGFLKATVV